MYMNEQLLSRTPVSKSNPQSGKLYINLGHRMAKRLVALLAVLIIVGLFSLCVSIVAGEQDAFAAATASPQSVEVVSGDTLWTIAETHAAKGQDIREYINRIKSLNHLKSSMLHEGQLLILP
ncbi:LysM peptidoglycan-binding domain-containing protein [Paenibacillus rigui]|uniref:LysM domain-containing protein n=1 Tax=Paenibacillus rigui TaxID=554312 RepID=A0A229UXR9_9BACL|nr:LysM peptidoglycan-binding domain-containing protein [Paenibacillus rigui]OXM87915.1 hypothetical protein CF651_02070 [Paenibacillus rigui]